MSISADFLIYISVLNGTRYFSKVNRIERTLKEQISFEEWSKEITGHKLITNHLHILYY